MWTRGLALVVVVGCGSAAPTAPTISIEPSSAAIGPRDSVTFRLVGGTGQFHWIVTPDGPALGQDGRLFAALKPGTYVITATSDADATLHAVANLLIYDDLVDSGGPVLATSKIYALWWGDPAAFPADAKAAVEGMLNDLNSSAYFANVTEYMRGAAPQTTFIRSMSDASSTPPTDPSAIEQPGAPLLARELCGILANENLEPDRSSIFLIYGSTFPVDSPWAGFHEWSTCSTVATPDAVAFPVAYIPVPDAAHLAAYLPRRCNSLSLATTWLLTVTAHEMIESITDPAVGVFEAWRSPKFLEVVDKCTSFADAACVSIGAHSYYLAGLYSNARHACVH
jgi:hypothetical protein